MTLMPGTRLAFVLACCMLLAACDDQVMVEQPNSFHTDVRSVAVQARGEGDIWLIVHGADSVGSPAAVENAVLAAMQGRPGGVNPRYTLDQGQAGQSTSTVHVVLNGPKAMTGPAICRGERAGSNQDLETTRAALAFCQGERALSSIKGRSPSATGPDDPKFRELLETTARLLFPKPEQD